MREWFRVAVPAALVVVGVGTAAWAMCAALADILTATATSDPEAAKWFAIPAFAGVALAIIAFGALSKAIASNEDLPARSVLSSLTVVAGIAAGGIVAALATTHLIVRVAAAVVAVAAIGVVVVRARMLREEVADVRVERARIDRLRTHGERVRGRVMEVEFPGVWVESLGLFHVAADYDDGSSTHRVNERLLLPINDAPVVGGTVLLWVDPDSTDPLDVFMEADPDSIRHPDPSEFLPAPGPETGGMGGGGA